MAPAGPVDNESWDDYSQSILAADLAAWKKKWGGKDAAAQKVKLVELSLQVDKLSKKLEDRIDMDDKLSRTLQKVQEQIAFLEERVAMEPTRRRAGSDDDDLPPPAAAGPPPEFQRDFEHAPGVQHRKVHKSSVCMLS